MSLSTTKKKLDTIFQEEIEDLAERINNVELGVTDAKEFSQLSSEALEALQKQINDLKFMILTLVESKKPVSGDKQGIYF